MMRASSLLVKNQLHSRLMLYDAMFIPKTFHEWCKFDPVIWDMSYEFNKFNFKAAIEFKQVIRNPKVETATN